MDAVIAQLYYMRPCFYNHSLTPSMQQAYPKLLAQVEGGAHVSQAPWNESVELTTLGGQRVRHFAKYAEWKAELYADWIALYFGSDLLVQSWLNGAASDVIPSSCKGAYKVSTTFTLSNIL